jgi:hypothetical protein
MATVCTFAVDIFYDVESPCEFMLRSMVYDMVLDDNEDDVSRLLFVRNSKNWGFKILHGLLCFSVERSVEQVSDLVNEIFADAMVQGGRFHVEECNDQFSKIKQINCMNHNCDDGGLLEDYRRKRWVNFKLDMEKAIWSDYKREQMANKYSQYYEKYPELVTKLFERNTTQKIYEMVRSNPIAFVRASSQINPNKRQRVS